MHEDETKENQPGQNPTFCKWQFPNPQVSTVLWEVCITNESHDICFTFILKINRFNNLNTFCLQLNNMRVPSYLLSEYV